MQPITHSQKVYGGEPASSGAARHESETTVPEIVNSINGLAVSWPINENNKKEFSMVNELCFHVLCNNLRGYPVVDNGAWQRVEDSMASLIEADARCEIQESEWFTLVATIQRIFRRNLLKIPEEYRVTMVKTGPKDVHYHFIPNRVLSQLSEKFHGTYMNRGGSCMESLPADHASVEETTYVLDLSELGHTNAVAALKYMDPKNNEVDTKDFDVRRIYDLYRFAHEYDISSLKDKIYCLIASNDICAHLSKRSSAEMLDSLWQVVKEDFRRYPEHEEKYDAFFSTIYLGIDGSTFYLEAQKVDISKDISQKCFEIAHEAYLMGISEKVNLRNLLVNTPLSTNIIDCCWQVVKEDFRRYPEHEEEYDVFFTRIYYGMLEGDENKDLSQKCFDIAREAYLMGISEKVNLCNMVTASFRWYDGIIPEKRYRYFNHFNHVKINILDKHKNINWKDDIERACNFETLLSVYCKLIPPSLRFNAERQKWILPYQSYCNLLEVTTSECIRYYTKDD